MYGSLSELEAMGVDPNQLLGLITHQNEEEEKEDEEQFYIKDDPEPEDESTYRLIHTPYCYTYRISSTRRRGD